MGSTVIAGKPSNAVGDKDSTLILRGSSVKILWGNKFIDLLKNGKINVEVEKVLKTSDSSESINQDGIYLVEDLVWVQINGTKVQLSGENNNSFVSFSTEQKDITTEQKLKALINIGFYYNTLEEAKNSGLSLGIVYVLADNKLYYVTNGNLIEYSGGTTTIQSLVNNDTNFVVFTEEAIRINKAVVHTQYAKYDDLLVLPENPESVAYDTNIPNLGWVRYLLQLYIPAGTIVMWHGTTIPTGWVICDGNNGSPNLIGKFIKSSSISGEIGGANTIKLTVENLPDHQHDISELSTSSDGSNTHSHVVPTQSLTSSLASTSSIGWETIANIEEMENITTVKNSPLSELNVGDTYLTNNVSNEHNHSIDVAEVTTDSVTEEPHTHTIEAHTTINTQGANNTEINIEPEYYSLIFIMKT